MRALKKGPLLTALDAATLSSLAAVLRSVTFHSSEDVIRQGDIGDRFYIVERADGAGRIQGQALTFTGEPVSWIPLRRPVDQRIDPSPSAGQSRRRPPSTPPCIRVTYESQVMSIMENCNKADLDAAYAGLK
ncbi:hypothetical protein PLESTB_001547900 [Pleodorina starrii]|uniref:Cyclic nucleotide-binding domain-containing protein n=1 Tax=Pleodorina starrii TaxID=330485 RepID=A0A9W6BY28_9CHLO|nr:hypothetical protein PLESTB_001547900 [Pleodorina starrii]